MEENMGRVGRGRKRIKIQFYSENDRRLGMREKGKLSLTKGT